MYIVAIRAFNQSFFNRVVRLPVEHGFYILMACETELIFIKFQALAQQVHESYDNHRRKRHFSYGLLSIQKSQTFGFFMACQTFGCSRLRISFSCQNTKIPPAPLALRLC